MIIGLTGYKGVGKSTVAEYLEKEYGFKRVNFKDGLVAEMKERFPNLLSAIAEEEFYKADLRSDGTKYDINVGWLFANKPSVMRALMQEYGTEVRRGDDPDYWVKKWVEKVKETGGNIVTDDVRFFNELSSLNKEGGVLIRVTREDVTTGGSHQSETEQESFIADFTIEGKPGSHAEVYKQVDSIIDTLKKNVD